jgi:hypothetical protein
MPLRAVIEEGLRRVLDTSANPLDALSWQDLRDEIYGGRRQG